jgi:PAS domain S-box-containing protein
VHGLRGELLYVNNYYVCLYDKQKHIKDFPYCVDERDGDTLQLSNVRVRQGLTEFVLRIERPQVIDAMRLKDLDASGDVTEGSGHMSFTTWLEVPRQMRGTIGGIMAVQAYEPGIEYNDSDADILSFVANHVSSAIERYQALAHLRRSEERYRTVIDYVGVVQDARMVIANPSMVRIVGHPLEHLRANDSTSTVHPDDVAAMVDRHERRLRGESVDMFYGFCGITQTGEVRSLDLSAVKIDWDKRPATLLRMFGPRAGRTHAAHRAAKAVRSKRHEVPLHIHGIARVSYLPGHHPRLGGTSVALRRPHRRRPQTPDA